MIRHLIAILSIITIFHAHAGMVKKVDSPEIHSGLADRIIAVWPSHGVYYNQQEDRWKWQRARLFGTVEDLYSQSYVVPLLIPMLENSGAYVFTPRERDYNTAEIIIDGDGGMSQGHFKTQNGHTNRWNTPADISGFAYTKSTLPRGHNPFRAGKVRSVATVSSVTDAPKAQWIANVPQRGRYAVYISYASTPQSAPDALYRVNSLAGSEEFLVDQRMGGGTWIYLGTFDFDHTENEAPLVELIATSSIPGAVVTADAVKIGGGMGNVERGGRVSSHPRRNEGARYWLQWAGIPDSVYSVTSHTDDYVDDYKSRGLWVNYLSGGSHKNPDQDGLKVPVDLSLAFHTDAGTTTDGSTIGTLGIISYGKSDVLGDGSSRATVENYAEAVTSQIVNDIRALYDPNWSQRRTRNRSYHEATSPVVPALLIELLSHQNLPDMVYGLDPEFRFAVARAIYKGIGRYLSSRSNRKFIVHPLPVNSFAISGNGNSYLLTWQPTSDQLEPSAMPEYYIVEERIDDGAFTELAVTTAPRLAVTPDDDRIYSYRIRAVNEGGISFPSEVLALSNRGTGKRDQVLIVNGFTRVSGPDTDYYYNGFDYGSDHGVPSGTDASFTGEQYDFNRSHEWLSDDAPGFGASRANFEKDLLTGNTLDNVYIHGTALHAAGIPFISSSRDGFTSSIPDVNYVDLILGKQKEIHTGNAPRGESRKTFTPELQNCLNRFINSGGKLLVSGAYLSTDLAENKYSTPSQRADDIAWLRQALGIVHSSSNATVTGSATSVKSPFKNFSPRSLHFNTSLSDSKYAVESPSSFSPAQGGAIIMRYEENGYPAAIAYESNGSKVVAVGFPLETVSDMSKLSAFMSEVFDFFRASPLTVPIVQPQQVSHQPKATKSPKSKGTKNKKKTSKSKKRK